MKFTKKFQDQQIKTWSKYYFRYRFLKGTTVNDPAVEESEQRNDFCIHFGRELERVEEFWKKKIAKIDEKIKEIRGDFNACSSTGKKKPSVLIDEESRLLETVEECMVWTRKLEFYTSLNTEAIKRILKKYDKRHSPCGQESLYSLYYSRIIPDTHFGQAKARLEEIKKFLSEKSKELVISITHKAKDGDGSTASSNYDGGVDQVQSEARNLSEPKRKTHVHQRLQKIWNNFYELEVKGILEEDQAHLLEQHDFSEPLIASINKMALHQDIDVADELVERESKLLLLHLLDGICVHSSVSCMSWLLEKGLNLAEIEEDTQISFIYKLCKSPCVPGGEEGSRTKATLELLISSGANITYKRADGQTLLQTAIIEGKLEIVRVLTDIIKEDILDDDDCNALWYAVMGENVEITKALLEKGFTFNNFNPIIQACRLSSPQLVKLLARHPKSKGYIDETDSDGCSALYHCAQSDDTENLLILLEEGAEVDIVNAFDGWTPLCVAAAHGYQRTVRILVEHGANKEFSDREALRPFELAIWRGHICQELYKELQVVEDGEDDVNATTATEADMVNLDNGGKLDVPDKEQKLLSTSTSNQSLFPANDQSVLLLITLENIQENVEFTWGPQSAGGNISLKISASKPEEMGQSILIDLEDDRANCTFTVSRQDCRQEIIFQIVSRQSVDKETVLGRGSVLLESLIDPKEYLPIIHGSTKLIIPIQAVDSMVAKVSCRALISMPFSHPSLLEGHKFAKWMATKLIGHRGSGANAMAEGRLHVSENTILSFQTAADLGAEYVEFGTFLAEPPSSLLIITRSVDVQLTKDRIPVLYHDFIVKETGYDVGISSLSENQFVLLNQQKPLNSTTISKRSDAKDRKKSLYEMNMIKEERVIKSQPTTLKEALLKVSAAVGFNIELKYPLSDEFKDHQLQHIFEINAYCESILKVVLDHSNSRPIIFSSFHPDVCLLISLKQKKYPVFFLTEAGMYQCPTEPRANSLDAAIKFAQNSNILGIVSHSTPLLMAPKLIQKIKQSGLMLMSYGPRNNNVADIKVQKRSQIDAVIVDSVLRISQSMTPPL